MNQSEGDVNVSPRRQAWQRENLDEETRRWLEEDEKYFLRQSLSTPCLNVLRGCDGSYIEDLQGRRLMDFHGNNVHQVGFGNRRVIEAIAAQMASLPLCTRRYTNIPAIRLAKKLAQLAPGDLNKVLFAPGGFRDAWVRRRSAATEKNPTRRRGAGRPGRRSRTRWDRTPVLAG